MVAPVMMRLSAVALGAVLLLVACGADDRGPTTPPPTDPSSASPTADPAVRRALGAAQKALVAADTGTVRTVVSFGPEHIETVATFQLSRRSMSTHATMSSGSDV